MPTHAAEPRELRILLVEDSAEDAELMIDQMREAGIHGRFQRVESEVELQQALAAGVPDIVLSDLSMPGFTGFEALHLVRRVDPELPFIFVSGTMGEASALAALRHGANDYIIKHQPARLPSAVLRAVGDAQAVRERRRVETELMRAQRLESLSLLAAGLSHDLRNILQPLLIMPELLKARTEDKQLHHMADVIAECGRRGHEMAESMLSFVRGSRKASEHIRIQHLFDAVALLLRSTLPASVQLKVEVDDPSRSVDANYTELQQVLLNLALNAVQAMPEGGSLFLRARAEGQTLCVEVEDEGIGMDAQTLEQLFSPFFTTKPNGTGLGLMSCKRIVEGCGGSIAVRSAVGQGTLFVLRLPLALEDGTTGPVEGQTTAMTLGNGQQILVVDGEATRLSLLGNALSSQSYQMHLVSDGAAALRWMQCQAMPAMVIVDGGPRCLAASHLLAEMAALGYAGPALVLCEDTVAASALAALPGRVRLLPKPLEMQQVFQAVAQGLAGT